MFGKRATLILIASVLSTLSFTSYIIFPTLLSMYINSNSLIIVAGLSVGMNDAAAYPALPLLLEEKYLGTGFGLFYAVQNMFIFVLPPTAAYIKINAVTSSLDGYTWMILFFISLACILIAESIILLREDRKNGEILELVNRNDERSEKYEDTIRTDTQFRRNSDDDIVISKRFNEMTYIY